jgi:hypothetical protein
MVIMSVMITAPTICSANGWQDAQNNIGTDKFAHAACSYVICDQLRRAGINKFWAGFTTLCIGAAKEKWIDNNFDRKDLAADAIGVITFEF